MEGQRQRDMYLFFLETEQTMTSITTCADMWDGFSLVKCVAPVILALFALAPGLPGIERIDQRWQGVV